MNRPLSSLTSLNPSHVRSLSRIGVTKASEIWIHGPTELAKKLKISQEEFQVILDAICGGMAPKPRLASQISVGEPVFFTTGDVLLDEALGGGMRVGMVTEICGESAAGKTQLALQIALTAQLDASQGGLAAGVAYFTTTAFLPVTRLAEIARTHPALRECNLKSLTDNVHNCSTISTPALLSALKIALVQLFQHVEASKGRLKPVRVLVIDSLGSLFHSLDKTTTTTLVERSKILSEVSCLIHGIASSKNAAVIIINQVTDVFQTESFSSSTPSANDADASPELIYKDQSIWFSRAPPSSSGCYSPREATMGLIWANQVNTRIMISRTRRRLRPQEGVSANSSNKRRKGETPLSKSDAVPIAFEDGFLEDEQAVTGTLIRSLSIVFSAVSSPCTLEFVILKEGIRVTDFRSDKSGTLSPRSLPQKPVARGVSKETTAPLMPPSQGFISARLTQTVDQPVGNLGPVEDDSELKEDFDTFDEEEWASYGMALGDLEEQWDAPELEPGNHSASNAPSEVDANELEILESSDAEENFLLDNILKDDTQS